MSHTTDDMKADLQKSLEALQTIRDEIRVRIHLAGMDAKDAWAKLEPRLYEAERLAAEVSETSRAALAEVLKKARELRESL
ncbi:MAG: hypothetical protein IT372_00440 [Polyangiaceae bacterium]|nr:hypothetical protein [Polyangiaceae bacterium]